MYLVVQEEDLLLKRLAEATGVNPLYLHYNKLNMFSLFYPAIIVPEIFRWRGLERYCYGAGDQPTTTLLLRQVRIWQPTVAICH